MIRLFSPQFQHQLFFSIQQSPITQFTFYLFIFNILIYNRRMSKIDQLKQTYIKDADFMGSKSRFGYFSLPPNHSAAMNAFQQKKICKDENGKVKTEQRNIFSGVTASGVLKKSFFNYQGSVFGGDPYVDAGKIQRRQKLVEQKKLAEKEIYKPLSLSKTPEPKAAYQYITQKPIKKLKKDYVDQNGKVKIQQRNILSNSSSTIQKLRLKQLKYAHDPYQYHLVVQKNELKKSITLRAEVPFKLTANSNGQFSTIKSTYGTDDRCNINSSNKVQKKQALNLTVAHDSVFKPSCYKKYDTFSEPQYMKGGQKEKLKKMEQKNKQKQSFRLYAPKISSKPSPSISGLKTNILRCIR